MESTVSIRLFGRLSIVHGEKELLQRTSSKAREILCYLILNRRRAVRREQLAEMIFNHRSPESSRKALRQALWQLRSDLDAQGRLSATLFHIDEEWIQFVAADPVWLDVDQFERAAGEPSRRTHAVGLYRNELLEGWDQSWCLEDRERLRQLYLDALDALIRECEAGGEIGAAKAYALLALHDDQTRECNHRTLMRCYAFSGDRQSALAQYERCVTTLRDIGVHPDEETLALAHDIRAGRVRSRSHASRSIKAPLALLSSSPAGNARRRVTRSR